MENHELRRRLSATLAELVELQARFDNDDRVLRSIPERLSMCRQLVYLERRAYHIAGEIGGPDPLPVDGPCLRLLADEVILLELLEEIAESQQSWDEMRLLRGARFEIERLKNEVDTEGLARAFGITGRGAIPNGPF